MCVAAADTTLGGMRYIPRAIEIVLGLLWSEVANLRVYQRQEISIRFIHFVPYLIKLAVTYRFHNRL